MSQKNTVNCILGSLSRDPTDVRCLNGQWPLRLWSLDTGYMETGLDNCTSQDQAHVTSTQQISRSAAECGRGHQSESAFQWRSAPTNASLQDSCLLVLLHFLRLRQTSFLRSTPISKESHSPVSLLSSLTKQLCLANTRQLFTGLCI